MKLSHLLAILVTANFFWTQSTSLEHVHSLRENEYPFSEPRIGNEGEEFNLNEDASSHAYCFRMTWLGPKFDRTNNIRNLTCKNFLNGAKGVPCVQPLVVTDNSNVPDTEKLWEEYQEKPNHIACRLVKGEVCAKYQYFFGNALQNTTYMCTKVGLENGTAPVSGCFKEIRDGHVIQVCICQSGVGVMPCNDSPSVKRMAPVLLLLAGAFAVLRS